MKLIQINRKNIKKKKLKVHYIDYIDVTNDFYISLKTKENIVSTIYPGGHEQMTKEDNETIVEAKLAVDRVIAHLNEARGSYERVAEDNNRLEQHVRQLETELAQVRQRKNFVADETVHNDIIKKLNEAWKNGAWVDAAGEWRDAYYDTGKFKDLAATVVGDCMAQLDLMSRPQVEHMVEDAIVAYDSLLVEMGRIFPGASSTGTQPSATYAERKAAIIEHLRGRK
jgi:hypothetical protein